MDKTTVKDKTVKGLKWSLVSQVVRFVIQLTSSIVLSRLLFPEDYGLFGMINVLIGYAMIFADFGFSSAIIQKKDISEIQLNTIFWLNIAVSIVLSLIFYFSSSWVAAFYDNPALVDVTKLSGLGFLVLSVGLVHSALLAKQMDFKRLFFIMVTSNTVSLLVAIWMAYSGYGVYALVFQTLLIYLINSVLCILTVKWKPSWQLSFQSITSIINFSKYLFATRTFSYWTRSIDNLLVGKFLNPTALGVYTKSYALMTMPLHNVSHLISRVIFPSFSALQNDTEQVRSIYLKVTKTIAMVTFPLMCGILVTADIMVPFVFGEQWIAMVPIVQVLSIAAIPQSIGTLNGNLYMFRGNTKLQFKVSMVMNLIVIAFICFGLFYGIVGVATFYMIGSFTIMYHNFKYPLALIEMKFADLVKNLFKVLTCAITMALAVKVTTILLAGHFNDYMVLLIDLVVGIGIYCLLIWKFEENHVIFLLKTVSKK